MTKANAELKHDPELPFVVLIREDHGDDVILARCSSWDYANQLAMAGTRLREVVDTTPKPKIPEDAEFIIWDDGSYLPQIAQRDSGPADLGWRYGAEEDYRWYSSEALSRDIGDAEVTVLVRKEES